MDLKPNDSVAWLSPTGGRTWGLVQAVADDGTVTVRSGSFLRRHTLHPDDITEHYPGPSRFRSLHPSATDKGVYPNRGWSD